MDINIDQERSVIGQRPGDSVMPSVACYSRATINDSTPISGVSSVSHELAGLLAALKIMPPQTDAQNGLL